MSNRALSPTMIGRQQQLDELVEYLAKARAGSGQVVFLAGEAGVGKTRLLREFTRPLVADPTLRISLGYCFDELPAQPYGPFTELLRTIMQSPEAAQLPDLAGPWAHELYQLVPELAYPADIDMAHGQSTEKRRLFQAMYQVVRPRAGQTHILVLEDLHWSDESSQELLLFLVRAIEHESVLIVTTYRTEEVHRLHPLAGVIARLNRERRYQEIRLAPLSRNELAEMLAATLGTPPRPDLLSTMYERTEGNPFFAEEVLDLLISDGQLALFQVPGHRGRRLADLAIPLSIKDSILRRVAALDQTTVAVLRAAAVVGRHFEFDLLLPLSGLSEEDLLRCLSTLIEHQLIAEDPGDSEDRYRFRHELIRAAIYDELLRRERRLYHQRVLGVLERLHSDLPGSAIDALAYHALQARALPQAWHYSELAGDKSYGMHAYRSALGHYEAALESSEQVDADKHQMADLFTKLGHTSYQLGDIGCAADYWKEALGLYQGQGMLRRAADLQCWLGRVAWEQDNVDAAFAHTKAAVALLEHEPPSSEQAMAYSALSHLYMLVMHKEGYHAQEAITHGERALELAKQLNDRAVMSHALNNMGVALADMGQVDLGLSYLEQSLEIAKAAKLPSDIVRAYINLGGRLRILGRMQEGLEALRKGWEYSERFGYLRNLHKLLKSLAYAELEAGDWENLGARIERMSQLDYATIPQGRTIIAYLRGMLLLQRGEYSEARDLFEQLFEESSDIDDRFHLGQAMVYVYRALDDIATAISLADQLASWLNLREVHHSKVLSLSSAVLVYLDVGRRADALALIEQMEAHIKDLPCEQVAHLAVRELRARHRMLDSPAEVVELFAEILTQWQSQGYITDMIRVRRLYASALFQRNGPGDKAQARRELAEAKAQAEQRELRHELQYILALEQQFGQVAAQQQEARPPAPIRSIDGLTPRELEVLTLVTRGLSNRAIAEELVIAEKTAEVHVRNILGKLGFSSRTQAATYAVERGIVALRSA